MALSWNFSKPGHHIKRQSRFSILVHLVELYKDFQFKLAEMDMDSIGIQLRGGIITKDLLWSWLQVIALEDLPDISILNS